MKNIAYVLSLLMLTLMTACSDRKEYVIAMSQCSEDIWREKLNTEMLAGTYLYDNVTLRVASANDDNVRQTEQINGFVNDGVDILIVAPNQMNTVTPAIENAYNKGIPVILFDRKTGSDKYTAFIGADNVKMGRTMGEYIASGSPGTRTGRTHKVYRHRRPAGQGRRHRAGARRRARRIIYLSHARRHGNAAGHEHS